MRLTDWARQRGISYTTARRWFTSGKLPFPAHRTETGQIMVDVSGPPIEDSLRSWRTLIYVRASSDENISEHLEQRLKDVAKKEGWTNVEIVVDIVSWAARKGRRKVIRKRLCYDEVPFCAEDIAYD